MNQPAFEADIRAEPEALARLLDADAPSLPDLTAARRVVMIGMGSSAFAAHATAVHLRARGVDAHVELASAATPMPPDPSTTAIGISASGSTQETVEALARHHGTSRTIAITNDAAGPITAVADEVIPLGAGPEEGGVACRTYLLTLASLLRASGVATAAMRPAVGAIAAIADASDTWRDTLVDILDDGPAYVIAPWERLSSALQGALMLREGPRIPADGCETGDWLHVDVYLSKRPDYRAILLRGSAFDDGVMAWARERRCSVVAIGPTIDGATQTVGYHGDGDPLVRLLAETSILELAASALWARRLAAGVMP